MVSMGRSSNAASVRNLATIFASPEPSNIGIASAKQTLHWTVPKLSTPEQCSRWSDLMPLLTWQLWLAKDLGAGNSSTLAKIAPSTDPWKSCTIDAATFNQDWESGCCSQTARKFKWVANRKTSYSKMSLSCGQKR